MPVPPPPAYSGIDLRSSQDARRLQVRSCRFDGEEDDTNVVACAPNEATFWGVYYQSDNCPEWLSLADFDTEAEARAFAFHIANGRAVYAYDTVSGERLA